MRITVFTSNQPRHVALIKALATIADSVYAVQECNTLFPGEVDDFFRKSPVMQRYFRRVIAAEAAVFGTHGFLPHNVRSMAIRMGDLNRISTQQLQPALDSDCFVIFGCSYIKGDLCEILVANGALNIHMGLSPWYRGSSCNFWALFDRRPDMVGATIHRLSHGLDSGDMLFHALPPTGIDDGFLLGMQAVAAAHAGLVMHLGDSDIHVLDAVPQDGSRELRYTRNRDFTDTVAADYLDGGISGVEIAASLAQRDPNTYLRPFIGGSRPLSTRTTALP